MASRVAVIPDKQWSIPTATDLLIYQDSGAPAEVLVVDPDDDGAEIVRLGPLPNGGTWYVEVERP